jgi:hypothetical protein
MTMKFCIVTAIALLITGCSLTVGPDGARTWSLSGEEAARAIIIYSK